MFKEMRRKGQQLSMEKSKEILKSSSTGILAVNGDGGYPYTIPVNFVFYNEKIYIHCAKVGHKIDAIENSPKVSFCVVEKDNVVPSHFATDYSSVVVFGRGKIIEDFPSILPILKEFGEKYTKDFSDKGKILMEKSQKTVAVIEITPEHITGKAASSAIQKAAKEE